MNVTTQPTTPAAVRQQAAPMLRVIIGMAVLLAVLLAALYLYWGRGPVIAAFPLFVPLIEGAMGLATFCVAFIAFCRCQVQRDAVSYWIGVGFITFFISIIFHLLTWPGLLPNGQGLIAHLPGTAAWIITIGQGLSGFLLLPAALVRRPLLLVSSGLRWIWSVAALVVGASVGYLLLVVFEAHLPAMVGATGTFTPLLLLTEIGLVLLFALGAVLSTQRYRQSGDEILAYVALTQIAWIFSQIFVFIGGKRYDLWWYLARVFVTGGYLVLLFGMLSEYVRLYRGERDRNHALELGITARKVAEEALQTSLREKEVLLKEIHHRVKNNMQVISSLVSLQADTLDNPALRPLFNDLRDQVRTMALVHEKLYQSASLARVDFAEYTRSLLNYLWRAHGEAAAAVRLTLEVHPVALSVETAVPCGLILNELVSNALKHAFRGRADGEITVGLHTEADGRVCLRVSDNGVGLPAGLDWRQSTSLGLQLVPMLTEQLDGTVEMRASGGTEFQLTFKPPELEPHHETREG